MTGFTDNPERAVREVTATLPRTFGDFTGEDVGALSRLHHALGEAYANLARAAKSPPNGSRAWRRTFEAQIQKRGEALGRAEAVLTEFERSVGVPGR